MSKQRIENVNLLPDRLKTRLSPTDLFDKVVNLRFNCFDPATKTDRTYVVRSDYEAYFPSMDVTKAFTASNKVKNECIIRKCAFKPSIKVQYKCVADTTSVELDIWISNFFMIDETGQNLMKFDKKNFPLQTVDVQLGYFAQFSGENQEYAPKTFAEWMEMKQPAGTEEISVQVLYVTLDKMPPDYTLHIHGAVGANTYLPPVAVEGQIKYDDLKQSELKVSIGKMMPPKRSGIARGEIEDFFFQNITRRFLRNPDYVRKTDMADYREQVNQMEVNRVSNTIPVGANKINVIKSNALKIMSDDTARRFGIRVYCSEGVKAKEAVIFDSKENVVDSEGNAKDLYLVTQEGFNATNAMNKLIACTGLTDLQFRFTHQGDIIVYTAQEMNDPNSVIFTYDKNTVLNTYYENIIPAVYSINVDGAIATIKCPYFFYVFPFETVIFKSRYSLNKSIASNYFSEATRFTIINQLISFATVDDDNEVQMMCVVAQ